jgi:hypothetical protein
MLYVEELRDHGFGDENALRCKSDSICYISYSRRDDGRALKSQHVVDIFAEECTGT